MPFDDTPKIWMDETETPEVYDNTSALMPIQEEPPLPSIEERQSIVKNSDLCTEHKGMLNTLLEFNKMADVLAQIQTVESQEQRRKIIEIYSESFVTKRLSNNLRAENLKNLLLERVLNNIDNLDLETTSNLLIQLHEVMSPDYAQAAARLSGEPTGIPGQAPGINLTINNATTDGAQITNNTLNANVLPTGANKETVMINSTMKQLQGIQMPKKKVPVDVTYNHG